MFRLEPLTQGRVRLIGRLDAAEAEQASSAFAVLDGPIDADCSGLEYISSAGISVLMVTYKRLHQKGHVFRLSARYRVIPHGLGPPRPLTLSHSNLWERAS
jgi:anti-anti-sigma factor